MIDLNDWIQSDWMAALMSDGLFDVMVFTGVMLMVLACVGLTRTRNADEGLQQKVRRSLIAMLVFGLLTSSGMGFIAIFHRSTTTLGDQLKNAYDVEAVQCKGAFFRYSPVNADEYSADNFIQLSDRSQTCTWAKNGRIENGTLRKAGTKIGLYAADGTELDRNR